jgi:hypothetical protein
MILQRMGDKCVHSLLLVLEIVKSHYTDSHIEIHKNIVKVLSLGCPSHLHYASQTHNSRRNQIFGSECIFIQTSIKRSKHTPPLFFYKESKQIKSCKDMLFKNNNYQISIFIGKSVFKGIYFQKK